MRKHYNIPKRAAGILLPVYSLPSAYGIGTFGQAAHNWVDFLSRAGQQYWQVLPLGPTSYGDSPYQSFSAFAGNPYFVDFDILFSEGLLLKDDYVNIHWANDESAVDYGILYQHREDVLRKAYSRFSDKEKLEEFRSENSLWIDNYALYMAIKATQGHRSWLEWDEALRRRRLSAIEQAKKELADDINYNIFVQYMFFKQWNSLRAYANSKNVQIIGDIPIYVSLDSADVWAGNKMFQLDENANPIDVSGCPPDGFSATGQLWGNPLYNWEYMEKDNYSWWIKRIQANFDLYDVLRIDHFRGLESYYAIPGKEKTAEKGEWRKGPGMKLISAIENQVPKTRIIAEDLGFLTDDVRQLLRQSRYPGMKVLQFAFDTREANDYSPYNYGVNNIVFTGTHDNDTMLGWAENAPADDVKLAMDYVGISDKKDAPKAFIRLALQNRAILAVVPMQDWLGLGSEARMNVPSTIGGINWRWRMKAEDAGKELCDEILYMAQIYGRKA